MPRPPTHTVALWQHRRVRDYPRRFRPRRAVTRLTPAHVPSRRVESRHVPSFPVKSPHLPSFPVSIFPPELVPPALPMYSANRCSTAVPPICDIPPGRAQTRKESRNAPHTVSGSDVRIRGAFSPCRDLRRQLHCRDSPAPAVLLPRRERHHPSRIPYQTLRPRPPSQRRPQRTFSPSIPCAGGFTAARTIHAPLLRTRAGGFRGGTPPRRGFNRQPAPAVSPQRHTLDPRKEPVPCSSPPSASSAPRAPSSCAVSPSRSSRPRPTPCSGSTSTAPARSTSSGSTPPKASRPSPYAGATSSSTSSTPTPRPASPPNTASPASSKPSTTTTRKPSASVSSATDGGEGLTAENAEISEGREKRRDHSCPPPR